MRAKTKTGASISVVVTRADGRVQNYGVVASNSRYFHLVGRHLARLRSFYFNRRT